MNTAFQLAVSTIAVAVLLSGPAAQATDVADLPLKASVLAKPNVIFGLDDSGSMDSELMLNNNDGAFWWDYNAKSGWNASGRTWFNDVGDASTQWRKMVYLFPNGTGTGNRVYADDVNDHFGIPPTAQFAWARSSSYNPLYYNPTVTYKPWSPAYLGSAVVNYGNASTTAAKSNPVYGSGTFDVKNAFTSTNANYKTVDWTFTALPGMKLPGTAQVYDSTAWKLVSAMGWTLASGLYEVPASKKYRLAMDYFPATYYVKETCTYDGSVCVRAPDGTTTLKRYEIKSANYATAAEYNTAIQNFANWWQFYRKRKLMLNAAMGQVLEPLTGVRMGVMLFNSRPAATTRVTMYNSDATAAASNGRKVAGLFYETNGSGGTPTRETLDRIGEEYMNTAGPVQYACQRNNAFVVTDGFANVATVSIPAYTKSTYGATAPQATTYDNSLADIALSYYTVNLRGDLSTGKVQPTETDLNKNPHLNTYGLALGARGLLFNGDGSVPPTDAAAWTNPTVNRHPSAVDDLWHASLNGRGKMYLANTPEETAEKIQAGLKEIISQTGAQGGVAVSTVNLSRGDSRAYFGTYNPAGWSGDVTAHPINAATGQVDAATESWSASDLLVARPWGERVIASASGGSGVGFTAAAVGSVVNPSAVYGSNDDVINYLRGDRSHEGTLFRSRTSLLGAVINSEPAVQRDQQVVYVQSGEGMLHALDTAGTTPGKELWAFVPRAALASIGETVERGYVFSTHLDGSPTIGVAGTSKTLLVAGMGAAGRSFHALDVSAPRSLTETQLAGKFAWEFPTAGDGTTQAKVGQALGRPRIVKSADNGYVVLVTSGYNSTADGLGRMWMLNADDGSVVHEFVTTGGALAAENGLAQISAYTEDNGTVRYVYGGDLLGNVWRFDLHLKDAPLKLAVLKSGAGDAQSVTAAPELVQIDGKRVVIVGTGRLLDITDFGSSKVQSVYAIADGAALANARSSLVAQTYNASDDTITANPVAWATGRGWYVDLPAGQQANTQPTAAYGAVAFTTNKAGGTDCSASSRLYVLDLLTGSAFAGTGFVSSEISATANSSGVTALATTSGSIVGSGQDANGNPWEKPLVNTNLIQPAKNSWREIRRQ